MTKFEIKQGETLANPDMLRHPNFLVQEGNSKCTKYCATVNMPALISCPADAPCRKGCYATSGNYFFDAAMFRNIRNYLWAISDIDGFFQQIEDELTEADNLRPWRWFRWHESGDILNYDYFCHMVEIARKFKNVNFMAYTKKYALVNRWIDENGNLPKNLTVIFSVWGIYGLGINKHNLPVAYVKDISEDGNAVIPKSAMGCTAGNCAACGFQCWKLRKRQSVAFDKH